MTGACGGDDQPADPPGSATNSDATPAPTTEPRTIDLGSLFTSPPPGYTFGATPDQVRKAFEELRASEDGESITAADARPLLFEGTQVGVQTAYTLDGSGDIDPEGIMDGYLASTGGGKVEDSTIDGKPVKRITKDPAASQVPFGYAFLNDKVVVFVTASTDEHASAVMTALLKVI